MKNERILVANDMKDQLDSLSTVIKLFGEKDGHTVVGKAASVGEVKALIENGLKPTVALIDHNFPAEGDGERARDIIKRGSPKTTVISLSFISGLEWGEQNWHRGMGSQELIDALTNLQH